MSPFYFLLGQQILVMLYRFRAGALSKSMGAKT